MAVVDAKAWTTKAAKEARDGAIAEGLVPILRGQWEQAHAMCDAAREQLFGEARCIGTEAGVGECVLLAEWPGGAWLRAMVDWIHPDWSVFYDYKTTSGHATPAGMARQCVTLGYAFQAAFYERVATLLKPDLEGRVRFQFVFQEDQPPYALAIGQIDESDMHVARRQVDYALSAWADCLARDEWSAYPAKVQPILLPGFAHTEWLAREMEELV